MTPISDLRTFVAALSERGALYEVEYEVDLVHELGAVLRACELSGRAALFTKVRGYDIPVLGGALGSPDRIAIALECETNEQVFERVRAARDNPVPPATISGDPACRGVVQKSSVNLMDLPIPTHAPLDGGPFINAGVVIARDPDTGRHNLSFCRMQVHGPALAGVNINLWRHMQEFLQRSEQRDENLPFCVAIGVDPVVLMGAAFRYPGDEYEIAGALRGRPVPVAPALNSDILVPADAEIILEGEIIAGQRHEEGPMAEFTGHYSGTTEQAVGRIDLITHRSSPIFETIAGASFEHLILGNALTREPALDSVVRSISARIHAVHLPPYGSGFTAIISLKEPRPGEARSVAIAALSSHVNVKTVIVTNDDVDIYNPTEVLWALSTRVRWDRDVTVIPGVQGNDLDPSSDERGVQAKMIIDTALTDDRPRRYQKVVYPPVDLRKYLSR